MTQSDSNNTISNWGNPRQRRRSCGGAPGSPGKRRPRGHPSPTPRAPRRGAPVVPTPSCAASSKGVCPHRGVPSSGCALSRGGVHTGAQRTARPREQGRWPGTACIYREGPRVQGDQSPGDPTDPADPSRWRRKGEGQGRACHPRTRRTRPDRALAVVIPSAPAAGSSAPEAGPRTAAVPEAADQRLPLPGPGCGVSASPTLPGWENGVSAQHPAAAAAGPAQPRPGRENYISQIAARPRTPLPSSARGVPEDFTSQSAQGRPVGSLPVPPPPPGSRTRLETQAPDGSRSPGDGQVAGETTRGAEGPRTKSGVASWDPGPGCSVTAGES